MQNPPGAMEMSKGFGGCVYVSCRWDGCRSGGAYFETNLDVRKI